MSLFDWLSDAPVVGDLIDLCALAGVELDAQAATAATTLDYETVREAMHWTTEPGATMDTRDSLLQAASQVDVGLDEHGKVVSGLWTDPVTGYTSTVVSDFDIDHRIPFSHVAETMPGFSDMTVEEQRAVFNDPDNLQVLHDHHNAQKGDALPDQYVSTINDSDVQERFLKDVLQYAAKVGIPATQGRLS